MIKKTFLKMKVDNSNTCNNNIGYINVMLNNIVKVEIKYLFS